MLGIEGLYFDFVAHVLAFGSQLPPQCCCISAPPKYWQDIIQEMVKKVAPQAPARATSVKKQAQKQAADLKSLLAITTMDANELNKSTTKMRNLLLYRQSESCKKATGLYQFQHDVYILNTVCLLYRRPMHIYDIA